MSGNNLRAARRWSSRAAARYATTWMFGWRIYCYFMFGLSVIISVWLAIGGFHNLWQLLAALRTAVRDDRDDGTVVGDRNLDDLDEEEIEELNIAEPE